MQSLSASKSTFLASRPVASQRPRRAAPARARAAVKVSAKYGDESRYFDLDDLENTAGSWDMYGQADGARYPGLQAEFFERAAAPVARREAVLGLLGLVFPSAIVAWGIKGSKDVKLPITVGPQKAAALGPRDKL